jgi:hypothetical protein
MSTVDSAKIFYHCSAHPVELFLFVFFTHPVVNETSVHGNAIVSLNVLVQSHLLQCAQPPVQSTVKALLKPISNAVGQKLDFGERDKCKPVLL